MVEYKKLKGYHRMPDGSLMKGDKHPKPRPKQKKEVVELDGTKIKIKKGALKEMLKVPEDYTFGEKELERLKKHDIDKSFAFKGNKFKMTELMKKRITLALTLMSKSKK